MGVLHGHSGRLFAIAQAVIAATVLTFAGLAFAGSAAAAPTIGSTGTITAPGSGSLGVLVTASVSASCQFNGTGPSGTYNVTNLNNAFTNDFDFSVACTSPFRVGILSANGALVTPAATETGYTNVAPYNVSLDVKGDSTDTGLVTCDAATITSSAAAGCAFKGPASSTVGLHSGISSSTGNTSFVRVSAPAYTGANILVASTAYIDTLTVTISPST